jgi:hypothetical protein
MKTAKDIMKEHGLVKEEYQSQGGSYFTVENIEAALEKYANYKTRELEALILQFRVFLTNKAAKKAIEGYNFALERNLCKASNTIQESYNTIAKEDCFLDEYDKHFGITTEKIGKTETI